MSNSVLNQQIQKKMEEIKALYSDDEDCCILCGHDHGTGREQPEKLTKAIEQVLIDIQSSTYDAMEGVIGHDFILDKRDSKKETMLNEFGNALLAQQREALAKQRKKM